MRERVLDQLARLGVDARGRIEYEQQYTPDDWSAMQIYKGATFSLAHGLDQMLFLRPQNRLRPMQGVYLVGGGTHPGSGLPVIYSSARISCRLLVQDLGMRAPAATEPALC